MDAVTPLALEVALAVQQELEARNGEVDRLRRQQVERARFEAELAQRRFLRVDPEHRLVADSLEADWNQKLGALAAVQEDYERRRQADAVLVDEQQRTAILALATDFPRLWRDHQALDRERKRMVRLVLEDVTCLSKMSSSPTSVFAAAPPGHSTCRYRSGSLVNLVKAAEDRQGDQLANDPARARLRSLQAQQSVGSILVAVAHKLGQHRSDMLYGQPLVSQFDVEDRVYPGLTSSQGVRNSWRAPA